MYNTQIFRNVTGKYYQTTFTYMPLKIIIQIFFQIIKRISQKVRDPLIMHFFTLHLNDSVQNRVHKHVSTKQVNIKYFLNIQNSSNNALNIEINYYLNHVANKTAQLLHVLHQWLQISSL